MNLVKAIESGDKRPQIYYNYTFALIKENSPAKAKDAIKNALPEFFSDERIRFLLNQYIRGNIPD